MNTSSTTSTAGPPRKRARPAPSEGSKPLVRSTAEAHRDTRNLQENGALRYPQTTSPRITRTTSRRTHSQGSPAQLLLDFTRAPCTHPGQCRQLRRLVGHAAAVERCDCGVMVQRYSRFELAQAGVDLATLLLDSGRSP